ncbi:MAG: 1,4-alpha-glucan branching enzyme, partial [Planctomycetota bacterium]
GFHPDWNTLIFNYGRNEVRDFLLSSARFWLDVYHIDGLRVDAVASMLYLDYSRRDGEWVPNPYGGRENLDAVRFLQDCNKMLHGDYPGAVTIAEESTAWPGVSRPVYAGGLGFTMKWDMGWMNDTLRYFRRDPVHRKYHHNELTFRQMYAYSENFVLPLSHDEVVHGKRSLLEQMPGDVWQKFANLRLLYGYQLTLPGKQLLFMGNEIGQWREWNHDGEIDWYLLQEPLHSGLKRFVTDLNRLYRQRPALYERDFDPDGFHWIDCDNAEYSLLAFFRTAAEQPPLVVIANFTPVPHEAVRFGVPVSGTYRELINSDSELYGGSNWGNAGGVTSEDVPAHGLPHSIVVRVPPLGMLIFEP